MFGTLGKLYHRDGLVQCHICGKFYAHLGAHVKRAHFVEADDYKREFGLKMTAGLIGEDLAEKRRQNTEHLKDYVEVCAAILSNLTPEQRQNRYISLQEKQEQKETKLASLEKARKARRLKCNETIDLTCPHCKTIYSQPKHNKNKRKYCSADCYHQSAEKKEYGIKLRKSYGRGVIKQNC